MLNYSLIHACMFGLLSFELFPWKIVTCMLIVMLSPCFHLVFGTIGSLEHQIEALNWFEFMHVCMFFIFMEIGMNWIYLKRPWALILQIEF